MKDQKLRMEQSIHMIVVTKTNVAQLLPSLCPGLVWHRPLAQEHRGKERLQQVKTLLDKMRQF